MLRLTDLGIAVIFATCMRGGGRFDAREGNVCMGGGGLIKGKVIYVCGGRGY